MTAKRYPVELIAMLGDSAVFQTRAFVDKQKALSVGQARYGDFNLGLHVLDDPIRVLNNRMQLLSTINEQLKERHFAPIERLHWVSQVHGSHVYDIDNTLIGMQPVAADAMVSTQSDVGLAIMTADCVPIVLHQPASGQIAAIHAGWQGLACGVIKSAAERFTRSSPIIAWMGACISQEHYEVDQHVRDKLLAGCVEHELLAASTIREFELLYSVASDTDTDTDTEAYANRLNKTQSASQYLHKTLDKLSNYAKVNAGKIKLNLPRLAADQLTALGITLSTNLPVDCSYEDTRYYSYRRQTHIQEPATGRMALIIVRSHLLPNP